MREGAWIDARSGNYRFVDEHCRWIRRPGNAEDLGLPLDVIEALRQLPWDLTPFAERTIVLFKAMEAGLIRARSHGAYTTFEHLIPWERAIHGSLSYMRDCFGPQMSVRFNDLGTGGTIEFRYGRYSDRLSESDLSFLLPRWLRPRVPPPIPRPFLVAETPDEGWICWRLPADLDSRSLVDLIQGPVPDKGGWLAIDSRTWWVTPTTPPLARVEGVEALRQFELCVDCGWPKISDIAPCKCYSGGICQTCSMPIFWPLPGREVVHLDGKVLHVPTFAAYGHRCISWAHVKVRDLRDLLKHP